jgi:hypothetical protein
MKSEGHGSEYSGDIFVSLCKFLKKKQNLLNSMLSLPSPNPILSEDRAILSPEYYFIPVLTQTSFSHVDV